MGMVGTVPARGNVLLAGDAAGLINPLQGEGIAQAMHSGRVAAAAILRRLGEWCGRRVTANCSDWSARTIGSMPRCSAASCAIRGRCASPGRVLTAPLVRTAAAGAWGLYWNDLVDGASPSRHRRLAAGATRVIAAVTSRSDTNAWFRNQANGSVEENAL